MNKNSFIGSRGFVNTMLEEVDWSRLDKMSDQEIQHLLKACRSAIRNTRDRRKKKDLEVSFCYLTQEVQFRKASRATTSPLQKNC